MKIPAYLIGTDGHRIDELTVEDDRPGLWPELIEQAAKACHTWAAARGFVVVASGFGEGAYRAWVRAA
ncbi:MAG: hypothetical protein KAX77_00865 [Xanthomonadales bacterium]|nr:hypothetical protein [Xanthomonadales bacterium]